MAPLKFQITSASASELRLDGGRVIAVVTEFANGYMATTEVDGRVEFVGGLFWGRKTAELLAKLKAEDAIAARACQN